MIARFLSDKVKVKTGRADNSAVVEFEVGEYVLEQIKELVTIRDKILIVTVEEYQDTPIMRDHEEFRNGRTAL